MITALAAPLAVAFLFSALIGGATGQLPGWCGRPRSVGVALDRRRLSEAATGACGSSPCAAKQRRDRVDRRTLDAALVIPTGFASVTSGGRSSMTVMRSADQQIGGEIGLAVATDVAQRFNNTAAAVALEASVRGPPAGEQLDELIDLPVGLGGRPGNGVGESRSAATSAPPWRCCSSSSPSGRRRAPHVERRLGVLDRVMAAPSRRRLCWRARSGRSRCSPRPASW
jgi:hypothetical protein